MSYAALIWATRLGWSHVAGIKASRLRLEPLGRGWSFGAEVGVSGLGLVPQGWDWNLKTGIRASRLN